MGTSVQYLSLLASLFVLIVAVTPGCFTFTLDQIGGPALINCNALLWLAFIALTIADLLRVFGPKLSNVWRCTAVVLWIGFGWFVASIGFGFDVRAMCVGATLSVSIVLGINRRPSWMQSIVIVLLMAAAGALGR